MTKSNKSFGLFLLLSSVLLSACGGGGGSSSSGNTSSDVQVVSSSISSSTGGSSYSILVTATGCRTLGANGTCTLSITPYTGTGIYAGPLTLAPTINLSSNISSCAAASATSNTCTVTITNNGLTTGQVESINFNGNQVVSFCFAGTCILPS